ncbi:MAG: hypothetical protein ACYC0C_10675 [Devosia sp.]
MRSPPIRGNSIPAFSSISPGSVRERAQAESGARPHGDEAQRSLIYGNLGDTITGRDDDFGSTADRDVDQVFYFFERAGLCANERICDYDVVNTFLGEEARTFWLYFSRYAQRRQAVGYARYGNWTERLAKGEVSRSLFGLI